MKIIQLLTLNVKRTKQDNKKERDKRERNISSEEYKAIKVKYLDVRYAQDMACWEVSNPTLCYIVFG